MKYIEHAEIPNKAIDKFCGCLMGLPIFAELSSSGRGLPDSHYEMNGIPLHSSMIVLVLLAFSHKFI